MEKQLHILKNKADSKAQSIIEILSEKYPEKIKVVLIQEGKKVIPTWKCKTYHLIDEISDPVAVPKEIERIDYSQLVDLLFESESIVGW